MYACLFAFLLSCIRVFVYLTVNRQFFLYLLELSILETTLTHITTLEYYYFYITKKRTKIRDS